MLTVRDFLEKKPDGPFGIPSCPCKSRFIGLDAGDGRKLFDTEINKMKTIEAFFDREILNIWADFRGGGGYNWGQFIEPVMCAYIEPNGHKAAKEVTQ